jgi:hypothetical protein
MESIADESVKLQNPSSPRAPGYRLLTTDYYLQVFAAKIPIK